MICKAWPKLWTLWDHGGCFCTMAVGLVLILFLSSSTCVSSIQFLNFIYKFPFYPFSFSYKRTSLKNIQLKFHSSTIHIQDTEGTTISKTNKMCLNLNNLKNNRMTDSPNKFNIYLFQICFVCFHSCTLFSVKLYISSSSAI